MSIKVEVRSELGEVLSPASLAYHRIVGWGLRSRFPMLGYTNATGNLVLNSLQVGDLELELDAILELSRQLGANEALVQLEARFEPDDFSIVDWDSERDLNDMLLAIQSMCSFVQAGEHRYLWFVGD